MIDLLKLAVPFKEEYLLRGSYSYSFGRLVPCVGTDATDLAYIDLEHIAKLSGLRLSARSVEYDIDGDLQVTGLSHPFDSLPSHWAGVAMKERTDLADTAQAM